MILVSVDFVSGPRMLITILLKAVSAVGTLAGVQRDRKPESSCKKTKFKSDRDREREKTPKVKIKKLIKK